MAGVQPRSEQAYATRAALIDAARALFVEKGYHRTGTEEIVAAAGVGTRGALYHHFADKRALFLAVFEAVEEDLVGSAAAGVLPGDAFGQLRAGLLAFLDASLTPEVQRVLLLDGPAVLGWRTWRSLEEKYGLGAIQSLLGQAVEEGAVRRQPLGALAHLLLAVIDEAALFVVHAVDPAAARAEAATAVDGLLAGIRTDPTPPPSRSPAKGGRRRTVR
ncbi:TetR/AcrR family transcriptional regulator [Acidiferrimicrobium sp. IK]|uniref:TetR/AcrR family transcriptional regulator n=1 Tax=Acidiferrimicrobium sp. IK TaxID=2871700 RepID=UPI0021CB33CF|nr:TetR/AcrR family transcriptional regulator [Acidiferrimicrobium sp. IK]MCU4183257.1 TetR/AcrR family transcriptional regulator [Acidiferrimicrobium sp. IK]